MKKLLSIILAITMLLSMGTVAFADEVTTGAREVEGIIKVGVNAEFAPFEYMDNDKLVGFDIDLMNYIAARIGYGVEFVNMSFDKLIPAVINGEVDCAISAITATDERESVVDFTRPYLAANVTYKDGEETTEALEMYSVVFKDKVADAYYLSRTPTDYEKLFLLVNGTIEELISDGTIEKLIVKYDLNKPYDEEVNYESGYYEYIVLKSTVTDNSDKEIPQLEINVNAAYVKDILKIGYENIQNIHLGRVNAEQYSEFILIDKPEDVKAFYNKFVELPFVEKAEHYDSITILFKSKNNGVLTSYYTTGGVFGGTYGNSYEKGKVEDKYVSEEAIYQIVEDLGYKWEVYEPDTYTDTSVAETVPAPSEWAAKDIDFALAVGITEQGKGYMYHENITREEFCELIYNLIAMTNNEITAPVTDSFTDTKNDKILMLNGLGIINGKSPTEFAPNDSLTREEAATIMIRMINKFFPMAATEKWFEYDDINEISEWASDSIQTISNMGIMNGVGNNRFAPKDTYTTEQAIVTLVRVLENAGASGSLDVGIIGGADGPTSIIVGESKPDEEFTAFVEGVKKNTTTVDKFYIDEAIKLVKESGELAGDKEFIAYYTVNDDMRTKVMELGGADYSKPSAVYYMEADREQIIANIKALTGEEAEGLDIEKLLELNKVSFATLPSLINASYGAESLAALTILTNSRGYVMPKTFKNNFALYLEYDEGCSALVTFTKYGDGVISANMSFVINGDRDNIFRRIYEIVGGLGEGSIDMAVVK